MDDFPRQRDPWARVRSLGRSAAAWSLLLSASPGLPAMAQPVGLPWFAEGPAPILSPTFTENVTPDNLAAGAIHAVAAHPTRPGVVYIGAVNGGIWRTNNATAPHPTWRRQTDSAVSLSIGALEFDPTDAKRRTLVAGIGRFSSLGFLGGARQGLLRTTNGGDTWTQINPGGALTNKNISGVAPRGATIVLSANALSVASVASFTNVGVFRTTDGGASFTQVSQGSGALTGLPGGIAWDLAGDPLTNTRLFTAITSAAPGGQNGIYRSSDTGATWTRVSNAAMEALMITGTTVNVEIAVGRHNNVYVGIINSGFLAGMFRSGDLGSTWTQMSLPQTNEGSIVGLHTGGQGNRHFSIVADPTNPFIVYVGGDRQPLFNEVANPAAASFPNSIGSNTFSGRLFRGDASRPPASQWVHLTHSNALGAPGGGTASNSAPHADSRELTFDAAGDLLEADDGGIYRRTSPRTNTGDWRAMQGNLQITELHDIADDFVSNVLFGGTQDNGTPFQQDPNRREWDLLLSGDGGDVAVDDSRFPYSARFASAQFLGAFLRSFWDVENNLVGFNFPALTVLGGGAPIAPYFYTPVELNQADPSRLVIGAANSIYESTDQGDTVVEAGAGIPVNAGLAYALAYGAADNPDVIWAAVGDQVLVRTGAFPAGFTLSSAYPGAGGFVIDLAMDPTNSGTVAVADALGAVFLTFDGGATWSNVTNNLPSLNPLTLRSVLYVPGFFGDLLVVGSQNGAFIAGESDGFSTWHRLGTGLPTVTVLDLDYDPFWDRLTAATLGRGAFSQNNLSFALF